MLNTNIASDDATGSSILLFIQLKCSSVHPFIQKSASSVHPFIHSSVLVHPFIRSSNSSVHPFIRSSIQERFYRVATQFVDILLKNGHSEVLKAVTVLNPSILALRAWEIETHDTVSCQQPTTTGQQQIFLFTCWIYCRISIYLWIGQPTTTGQ